MPKILIAAIQAEAVATAATETLIQVVTGSTAKARIKEWGVSFDGTDATKTPIRVDLLRQTTAGTASSLTLVKNDPDDTAALASAQKTFTVEPTAGDVLWSEYITPAGGFDRVQLPLGEEIVMQESERLGLRVVVPSGSNCNATAYIRFEE